MMNLVQNEHHISSLVIQCVPNTTTNVEKQLAQFSNLEINLAEHNTARIIAVLETATAKQINQVIDQLQQLDGVISVAMVYHHCEPLQTLNEAMI